MIVELVLYINYTGGRGRNWYSFFEVIWLEKLRILKMCKLFELKILL